MNAFAYMLDIARKNAHKVFKEIKQDIRTFDFVWQLGMLLLNVPITRRLANSVGLEQTVVTKMHKVLKVVESPKAAEVSMLDASDRNRCHLKKYDEKYKENKNSLPKSK